MLNYFPSFEWWICCMSLSLLLISSSTLKMLGISVCWTERLNKSFFKQLSLDKFLKYIHKNYSDVCIPLLGLVHHCQKCNNHEQFWEKRNLCIFFLWQLYGQNNHLPNLICRALHRYSRNRFFWTLATSKLINLPKTWNNFLTHYTTFCTTIYMLESKNL